MSKRRKRPPRRDPPSRQRRLDLRALERKLWRERRPRNLWEQCQIYRLTRPHLLPEIEATERRCAPALKGWETRRRRAAELAEQGGGA